MKIILALTIIVILSSCLPSRLVPFDYSIKENNYEAFIEIDSVTIALHNQQVKSDYYVFWMEVENNSNFPVSIELDRLRKNASIHSYRDNASRIISQEEVSAMNKDQIYQFFREKERSAQAAAAFLFFVGAAIVTYDAIKDEQDIGKESWTYEDERKSVKRDIIASTAVATTDILTEAAYISHENARTDRHYLLGELFNKELIYPGERYQGKIIFRKYVEIQPHHRLVCPVDGKNWIFDFRKATPKEKKFLYDGGW